MPQDSLTGIAFGGVHLEPTSLINKINGKHPWANRRQRINQSERALCFSYVINSFVT